MIRDFKPFPNLPPKEWRKRFPTFGTNTGSIGHDELVTLSTPKLPENDLCYREPKQFKPLNITPKESFGLDNVS